MHVYLARHTHSQHNADSTANADPANDKGLTELGVEQAHALADSLADKKFGVIYISELPRTQATAEIINDKHHAPVIIDKRLNENDSGFEGQSLDTYLAAFHASKDKWNEAFNGGESLSEVKERVRDFLGYLKQQPHDSVLIVTHGYNIECIHGILNHLSFEEASSYQIEQGAYAEFEI